MSINKPNTATKSYLTITFIAFILMNAWTTVDSGHNKVQSTFGKINIVPLTEGFHIVNPISDFTEYDLRDRTMTWKEIKVPAQDELKSSMDVSVTFSIVGSETPNMKKTAGDADDAIEKYVSPKVRSLLREAGKSVENSQDFYLESVQQELQAYMETGLRDYLYPKGIEVKAVLFRDISLPEVVTEAVIQTKQRQEQLEREKAQLSIVEQQAQKQVKQAEAEEMAAISQANAKRTQADAEAYRIAKEAEATAKANRLLARSLTKELIQYNSIKKWSGNYPSTVMSGGSSGVLMNLPNVN